MESVDKLTERLEGTGIKGIGGSVSARQFCLLLIQFFPYHLFHELGYKVSFHLASKIQELTLAVQILLWPNRTEESV